MVLHKDLTGPELHPGKITIDQPTRAPAFPGEPIFDLTTKNLWIASSTAADGWEGPFAIATDDDNPPAPSGSSPIVFSWSLDLNAIGTSTIGTSSADLVFYYAPDGASLESSGSWDSVGQFTFGDNLAAGSVVDLNRYIQQRGSGYYLPLISKYNPGLGGWETISTFLAIQYANTSESAIGTQVEKTTIGSFTALNGRVYSNVDAFRCLKPLSHVVIGISA